MLVIAGGIRIYLCKERSQLSLKATLTWLLLKFMNKPLIKISKSLHTRVIAESWSGRQWTALKLFISSLIAISEIKTYHNLSALCSVFSSCSVFMVKHRKKLKSATQKFITINIVESPMSVKQVSLQQQQHF